MKPKKSLYLSLTILLGILMSYLVHALVELWYIDSAIDSGQIIVWTRHFGIGSCALPWLTQYGLFAIGAVSGIFLSQRWWQIVYVEGKHGRKKK